MAILTDRESTLLGNLAKRSTISQRELAKSTGMSLGLINVLLKRFVKIGYIQVTLLNKKRMEYLLTHQGTKEALEKTYHTALLTVQNYQAIRNKFAKIIQGLHQSGYEYFSVHGEGDLKKLIEDTLENCLEEKPVTLGTEYRDHPRAVVLNVSTEPINHDFKGNVVNLLEMIGLEK